MMDMQLPEKPLCIYDGDCGFCKAKVERWKRFTGERVEYAPYQEVSSRFPEISTEQFIASVYLIEPSGRISKGAQAVFRILTYGKGFSFLPWMYQRIPGVAALSEWGYRIIARNRHRLSPSQCSLPGAGGDSTFFISRRLFLTVLGIIYGIAFFSLWTQILGLIGENGISPVREYLKTARQQLGLERFLLLPTLCWINSSNGFLQSLCAGGVILSLLLTLGWRTPRILFLLWGLYLSLCVAGQQFLEFQWDTLLLEAGFLAIFLVPPGGFTPTWLSRKNGSGRERRTLGAAVVKEEPPPSRLVLWLFWWLLFRLTFSSALVKWMSGDPAWRNLTALLYHYETQPLPTWIGWHAHQFSFEFQKFSAAVMFVIEGIVPFLIFINKWTRAVACAIFVGFQILIAITGNYCFFNLLTIALCLFLLEDSLYPLRFRRTSLELGAAQTLPSPQGEPAKDLRPLQGTWPGRVIFPMAAVILTVTSVQLSHVLGLAIPWPKPIVELYRLAVPFRTVNSYGLFAVMTTRRPEIVVEGSSDGTTWLAYEFKYKPGDVKRRPTFVAPHQPRLDWQMWFAALGKYQQNPWFISFCKQILRGEPNVLRLLKSNPFPKAPPRYIRVALYEYRFTDAATRKKTRAWWKRQWRGWYCPTVSLKEEEKGASS